MKILGVDDVLLIYEQVINHNELQRYAYMIARPDPMLFARPDPMLFDLPVELVAKKAKDHKQTPTEFLKKLNARKEELIKNTSQENNFKQEMNPNICGSKSSGCCMASDEFINTYGYKTPYPKAPSNSKISCQ